MPVTLDFTKAQPINQGVTLDFAKAQPIKTQTGPTATISSRPSNASNWLEDLESDLTQGGSRTAIGRALGWMQGRGQKGYSGLQSGVSPGAVEYMGSPIIGPLHMAQGVVQAASGHPIKGAIKTAKGALETTTIPSSFVAPEAGATGQEIASVVGLPTKSHAGKMLEDVAQAAKNTTVDFRDTSPELQEYRRLQKISGEAATAVTNLSKRVHSQAFNPVKFPEARDFYSFVSEASKPKTFLQKLSGGGMSQKMLRQVQSVRSALNSDLTRAADAVGQAEKYTEALKEYQHAVKLQHAFWTAVGIAGTKALSDTPLAKRALKSALPTKF